MGLWWSSMIKFYDELVNDRQEMELRELMNIGSIHGKFKTGIEDWMLVKGSFLVLHDRRADHCNLTATRWIKDKPVAGLLEIWPN